MRCPRCSGVNDAGARSCGRCGAPLLLDDDPALARLDRALDLDRRQPSKAPILSLEGAAGEEPGWAMGAPGALPRPLGGPAREAVAVHGPQPELRLAVRHLDPEIGDVATAAATAEPMWAELGDSPHPLEPDPPCEVPKEGKVAALAKKLLGLRVEGDEPDEPEPVEATQRRPEPADAPGWRRAAAWGIDAAVLAAASSLPLLLAWRALPSGPGLAATLLPTAALLAALLAFPYAALGHALMGATFGKRLLGLQVVGPDGGLPTLARSAARSALAVLGALALGLGPLMALFTRSRRALHDLVADTVVIRTP